MTIVEIELKNKRTLPTGGSGPIDPARLKHARIEFENNQVRVVRVRVGPRETVPMHEHSLNRVAVFLTEHDFKVTNDDGKVETPKHKAGDIGFSGAAKHKEENLSDKSFEVLVVELKR